MAGFYRQFKEDGWSLEPLGLEERGAEGGYFCTPKGAVCIGWPGVDGIHFCFIRGQRERVFAVSPMNTPGTCVHPVARSFRDFLRLLLSCSAAALEQMWQWSRETFCEFVQQDIRQEPELHQLARLAKAYGLRPMADPYAYVKELQQEFREQSLSFPEEYDELCRQAEAESAWQVYFGGLYAKEEGAKPGREVVLNRSFQWQGQPWQLLSGYLCEEGLAADFAVPVKRSDIEAYLDRWLFLEEMGMTPEQQEQAEGENPFLLDVQVFAAINGGTWGNVQGEFAYWNPLREEQDPQALRWMVHYGLDRENGWIFQRCHWRHRWQGKGLTSLKLRLREEPREMTGMVFCGAAGDAIDFIRPSTGQRHTLFIEAVSQEQVAHGAFTELELPDHCRTIIWRVEPELPRDILTIRDRDPGDRPRNMARGSGASGVGIIGGADGPTAVVIGAPNVPGKHVSVSGLYFDLPEQTTWQMVFREPRRTEEEIEVFP